MSTHILSLRWGWLIAAGAAMLLMGILSIALADTAGLALIVLFGWLLLVGGAVQLAGALRTRAWRGGVIAILLAALRVVVGLLFLLGPAAWANRIVFLIGLLILVDGAIRVILALQARPDPGWGSILLGGSAAVLLGLLILSKWPGNGAWVIGLLFGVHLLLDGWATLMLATAARAALS